jgi:hypothetical protein
MQCIIIIVIVIIIIIIIIITGVNHILAWFDYTVDGLSILFLFDPGFSAGYSVFLH